MGCYTCRECWPKGNSLPTSRGSSAGSGSSVLVSSLKLWEASSCGLVICMEISKTRCKTLLLKSGTQAARSWKSTSPAETFLHWLERLLRASLPIHPSSGSTSKANHYCQGWRDQNNGKKFKAVQGDGNNELRTLPPASQGPALPTQHLALNCRKKPGICLLFFFLLWECL